MWWMFAAGWFFRSALAALVEKRKFARWAGVVMMLVAAVTCLVLGL